jgi:hypothetical protein
VRKGLEAGLTLGMETVWSKKRILTVYLNIAEFGDGVFGVEAAAQRYFNKPASRLSMSEAALLAAVLPNPIRFKASAPSGYVRSRQAWIMRQMRQLGGRVYGGKYYVGRVSAATRQTLIFVKPGVKQRNHRRQRFLFLRAGGFNFNLAPFGGIQHQQRNHAVRFRFGTFIIPQQNFCIETLHQLKQLHRRACMHAQLIGDLNGLFYGHVLRFSSVR